jgi:hypothetical protein
MRAHGVDGRLLPLVILTELGGGLPILFGLKTRWGGDTALRLLFADCVVLPLQLGSGDRIAKERGDGRRFPDASDFRRRRMVAGRLARAHRLGMRAVDRR